MASKPRGGGGKGLSGWTTAAFGFPKSEHRLVLHAVQGPVVPLPRVQWTAPLKSGTLGSLFFLLTGKRGFKKVLL